MGRKGRPLAEDKKDKLFKMRMNDKELAQLNFLEQELRLPKSAIVRKLIYREAHMLYYGYSSQKYPFI